MSDQGIIASLAFGFTVLCAMVAFLYRAFSAWAKATSEWTRIADRVGDQANDIRRLAEEAKDDRRATDRRLRWLEERMWGNGSGSPGPISGPH